MEQLTQNWDSLVLLWALTLSLSEFVDRFTRLDGFAAQVQSWVVAILLATAGAYFNLGMFSDQGVLAWYYEGPIVGFITGLVANGTFTIPLAKILLEKARIRPKD